MFFPCIGNINVHCLKFQRWTDHHILFQDSVEGKYQSSELETLLRDFDIWIDKDVNVGAADNMVIGLEFIVQIVFPVILYAYWFSWSSYYVSGLFREQR